MFIGVLLGWRTQVLTYHYIDIILITKGVHRMPVIRPISDLRNKSNEISGFLHKSNEPIFITKNGEGDMVVMSISHYAQLQKKLELYSKLAIAESQRSSGDNGRALSQIMKDIKRKINAKV
jgi:prevent-host-death family protein